MLVRGGGSEVRDDVGMAGIADQRLRDLRHRQYEIDGAGRDRALRHSVIGGLFRILGDDEPAFFANRFEPDAAIGAGSRQDDADRALAARVSQRIQEEIKGQARTVRRLRVG